MDWVKDVVIPLVSGLGGAVVGAAASYLASSRLAKHASDEVLRRDEAARLDQNRRAAHQVFVKLHAIANSLGSFQKQVTGMVNKAANDGNGDWPLHQKLSPLAGIEREPSIDFSAEELAIYIAAKRPDYVDSLLLLSRRHGACIHSLATFAKLKTEFHFEAAQLGTTTRDTVTGASTTRMHVAPEMANYIKVKAEELELFSQSMSNQLNDFSSFARDVAIQFGEVTETIMGGNRLSFQAIEQSSTEG